MEEINIDLIAVWGYFTTAVTIATYLVRFTPTKKDDGIIALLNSFVRIVSQGGIPEKKVKPKTGPRTK